MNEWIPVTDRLPESPDFVLVTGRKASDYKHVWVGIDVYLPKEDMWSEYVDVTAWMPLPEPYSKREERRMKEYICKEVQTDNGGYLEPVSELIRCKDCKYLRFTGTVWKCQNRIVMMLCEMDDFCSRAERKEE